MLFVSLSQLSLKSEHGWTHVDKAQKTVCSLPPWNSRRSLPVSELSWH